MPQMCITWGLFISDCPLSKLIGLVQAPMVLWLKAKNAYINWKPGWKEFQEAVLHYSSFIKTVWHVPSISFPRTWR